MNEWMNRYINKQMIKWMNKQIEWMNEMNEWASLLVGLVQLASTEEPTRYKMSPSQENLSSGLATREDSNKPTQFQKLAKVLKFWR